jgi:hypothetical protein
VRRLRGIVLALAAGLAIFLIAAALVAPLGGGTLVGRARAFVAVGYGMALAHGLGFVHLRRSLVARIAGLTRGDDPADRAARLHAYQVLVIVRAALVEGAALLAIVFYALTGAVALVPVPLAGVVILLSRLPGIESFAGFAAEVRRS